MRKRIKMACPVCSVTDKKFVNLQTPKEKRYCVFMAAANKRVMTHKGAAFVLVLGKRMYLKTTSDVQRCVDMGLTIHYDNE